MAGTAGTAYATIGFAVRDNGGTQHGGHDTSATHLLTVNVTGGTVAPPVITVTPPAATIAATSEMGAPVSFAGTATDVVDGTDPIVFHEGTAVVVSGMTFGLGQHTIVAAAVDAAGHSAAPVSFSFTVADETAPFINVTRPSATVAATAATGAAVTFSGRATDLVDGSDPVVFHEGTAVVTSGETFALGSHTIVATATDAAGNGAIPVSFTFAVADETAPVITVTPPAATIAATSAAGAVVTFSGTAADAVDGSDAVVFREGTALVTSGATFGLGSHTITGSASDAAGNGATAVSFIFAVADETAPVITVTPPAATIAATSAAGAVVTFSGTAADAVDGSDAVVFREGTALVTSGDDVRARLAHDYRLGERRGGQWRDRGVVHLRGGGRDGAGDHGDAARRDDRGDLGCGRCRDLLRHGGGRGRRVGRGCLPRGHGSRHLR